MNELIILDIELRAIKNHISYFKVEYELVYNSHGIYTAEENERIVAITNMLCKLREIEIKISNKIVSETIKKYESQ